jgi:hypothetical protein
LGEIWGELLAGPIKKFPEICIKAVYGGILGIAIYPRSIKNLEQPFRTEDIPSNIFLRNIQFKFQY